MAIFDRSTWLGLLLSAGSIVVLAHGFLDTGSITTGVLLATVTAVLILTGSWRHFSPNASDAAFALLAASMALSFAAHGIEGDRKELALLVLTLLAYPAARLMPDMKFNGLVVVMTAVVAVGTVVTIPALIEQWSLPHGKPLVFGLFDSAATLFATTLGLLLIFLTSCPLSIRRAAWIAVGSVIPTMVFAASMVRFVFLATLAALAVSFLIAPRGQRAPTGLVIIAVVFGILAGGAVRSSTTAVFLGEAAKSVNIDLGPAFAPSDSDPSLPPGTPGATSVTMPPPRPDCPTINFSNSIDIRKELLSEAVALLSTAGITGIGFDGFLAVTCVPGHPVHNSFLQVVIEFGWPAGIAMIALLALGLTPRRFALARSLPKVRFACCWLIFAALASCAYGRISRDTILFLAFGFAASLTQQYASRTARSRTPRVELATH